jgi:hypothetical protein
MKASRLLIAGAVAALLPLAGAVAQSPTPDQSSPTTTPTPSTPATPATPAEPAQGAPSSRQGATFESLDTDSDGRISKTEAAANMNVSEQFSRYDKNDNGYIERDEVNGTNSSSSDNPSKQ